MRTKDFGITDAEAALAKASGYNPRTIFNWRVGAVVPGRFEQAIKVLGRAREALNLEAATKENESMEPRELLDLGMTIGDLKSRVKTLEDIIKKLEDRDKAFEAIYKNG